MGGIFKSIGKIAKIALPVALTAITGGAAAPVTFGSIAAGIGKSLAINALTGAVSSAIAPKAKASSVTGQVQATADAGTAATTAESADEIEKKKRLALNAAGSSGTTTSPLGVTTPATVTKRNLLGL